MRVRDLINILGAFDPDLPILGDIDHGQIGELWEADVIVCDDFRPPIPGKLDFYGKQNLEWTTYLVEDETEEQRPKTKAVFIR